jgi:large subunit ribosomal protein L14e
MYGVAGQQQFYGDRSYQEEQQWTFIWCAGTSILLRYIADCDLRIIYQRMQTNAVKSNFCTFSPVRKMVFTRFVQIGRVAMINFGEDAGKLCVIVNVLDLKRVLVDGPVAVTGVTRQTIPVKRLVLTDFVLRVPVGARAATLEKALKKDDIIAKFAASKEGKLIAVKKARASTTDFDRFKLMLARKSKARAVNVKLAALRKKA